MSTSHFHWGYEKETGPEVWADHYSTCKGNNQSPIDIVTNSVQHKNELYPIEHRYHLLNSKTAQIKNGAHTWVLEVVNTGSTASLIKGVPTKISDVYVLNNLHMHWGADDNSGSEHTIDGKKFSSELHMVHWNATKYKSYEEALAGPSGAVCVIGVLFELGNSNEELDKIINHFDKIEYAEEKTYLTCTINPQAFIPENPNYYFYAGSLTVPKCNECVKWILFEDKLTISKEQLSSFRKLRTTKREEKSSGEKDKIHGFQVACDRPTNPLGERVVVKFVFNKSCPCTEKNDLH